MLHEVGGIQLANKGSYEVDNGGEQKCHTVELCSLQLVAKQLTQ
jgi:hypothetical protein